MPGSRGMRPPINSMLAKWRRTGLLVNTYSECLGIPTVWLSWELPSRRRRSLPPSYKSFVLNYNMQGMNKSVVELFAMLKAAESEIQKEHQVLMVNKTNSFKKNGKGKKGDSKKSGKAVAPPVKKPKVGPKPETTE